MKKLLSILGAVSLIPNSIAITVACNNKNYNFDSFLPIEIDQNTTFATLNKEFEYNSSVCEKIYSDMVESNPWLEKEPSDKEKYYDDFAKIQNAKEYFIRAALLFYYQIKISEFFTFNLNAKGEDLLVWGDGLIYNAPLRDYNYDQLRFNLNFEPYASRIPEFLAFKKIIDEKRLVKSFGDKYNDLFKYVSFEVDYDFESKVFTNFTNYDSQQMTVKNISESKSYIDVNSNFISGYTKYERDIDFAFIENRAAGMGIFNSQEKGLYKTSSWGASLDGNYPESGKFHLFSTLVYAPIG